MASGPEAAHGPAGVPERSLGFLLSQLGYATSRRFHRALLPLGLDPRQFAMLRYVAAQEGRSQQEIGGALQIPPSRMVSLVDDLEARGLLERRQHPQDRRARALHLTAAGRTKLEQAWAVALATEAYTCAALTDRQRDELVRLLSRVAEHHGLLGSVHPGLVEE